MFCFASGWDKDNSFEGGFFDIDITLYLPLFFLDDFWYCKMPLNIRVMVLNNYLIIILIGYTSRFRTVQDYLLCSQKTENLQANCLAIFILCSYRVNLFSQKLDDRIFTLKWDNHVIYYFMICGCCNQIMLWISTY